MAAIPGKLSNVEIYLDFLARITLVGQCGEFLAQESVLTKSNV
jgi:hypothetical protein